MTAGAEHIMKVALQTWNKLTKDLAELNKEFDRLKLHKGFLLVQLQTVLESIKRLKETEPHLKFPELEIPPELLFSPDMTIGDAMEIMLKERGPLTQREIINLLGPTDIRISKSNPHVVIANTIRKDKRNRFRRLKDGRVALAKKKE